MASCDNSDVGEADGEAVEVGEGEGEAEAVAVGEGEVLGEGEGPGPESMISRTPRRSMLEIACSGKMVTTLVPAGVVTMSSLVSELIERG